MIKKGDISVEIGEIELFGELNLNFGVIWYYGGEDYDGFVIGKVDGEIFCWIMLIVFIVDGLVIVLDFSG